mmetsp:Transcript_3316/g.7611  ORF Transcript_3316/g.7611 Transcript_3316/m.7611 type:complete len:215 (+) Transcript_3316:1524-2168(+)
MKAKFLARYAVLYQTGVLKTEAPTAQQVWNGDELGWDPNGNFSATLTYDIDGGPAQRGFRLSKGNKAPFWVTMFFFSRVDGVPMVPPVLVHKGGTATHTPSVFLQGVPPDWTVHNTASGYMDQEGFKLVAHSFVQHSGASPSNPQFIFLDGHESHWCAAAIVFLKENNVHMFFLKSNDSIMAAVRAMAFGFTGVWVMPAAEVKKERVEREEPSR